MRAIFPLVLLAAACGSDDAIPAADQVACSYLQVGPFQDTPVGEARDSAAPLLEEGTVLRLTSTGGFVALGVTTPGEVGVYASDEVTLEITDDAGAVVTPVEETASSAACAEIRRRVVVTLDDALYFVEVTGGAPPFELVTQGEVPSADGE